jgi:hypothetical protein
VVPVGGGCGLGITKCLSAAVSCSACGLIERLRELWHEYVKKRKNKPELNMKPYIKNLKQRCFDKFVIYREREMLHIQIFFLKVGSQMMCHHPMS